MSKPAPTAHDKEYLALIFKALDTCSGYLPKLPQ